MTVKLDQIRMFQLLECVLLMIGEGRHHEVSQRERERERESVCVCVSDCECVSV